MNEQIWYLYQNGQQMGPFDKAQLVQLHNSKMIAQDAYVFKVGWKEWRPVEEVYEELGLAPAAPKDNKVLQKRRAAAPRASISGSVIVHNDVQLALGHGVNISSTGIFIETKDQIFTVGEKLKLTVRCAGLRKPFNVTAEVIRFNAQGPYPTGYGLRFESLGENVQNEIERLVRDQQVRDDGEAPALSRM